MAGSSCLLLILLSTTTWPCALSANYEETSSEEFIGVRHPHGINYTSSLGISPPVLNLATQALIFSNATCGEREPETYCKLVEHVHLANRARASQCQVCDQTGFSNERKRHPIKFAIDGSNRWWQSPTLQNGRHFEWVTITIDLKQVYQVAYIIIKAGISPRPGNWILERSLDGVVFMPWQYYAISDEECWIRYRIRGKPGKPRYDDDEEIICTSYYSSLHPLEGGEIHTSLVNGRPGADGPSERLTKFTMARFVRLRLQKIRTLHGDLMNMGGPESSLDKTVMRRYFYSIKDISIGGHCVCFGHANECVMNSESQTEKCMCQHNTCGDRCDTCCPLFNQYLWGAGGRNSSSSSGCHPCECHGQADACIYDPLIAAQKLSMNTLGVLDGGGVCLDCKGHSTGINCERCEDGYYRPKGVSRNDPRPCLKCLCHQQGSDGSCVGDERAGELLGKEPGDCICKEGYSGQHCDTCALGYKNFPNCLLCPCHLPGIQNMECDSDICVCKDNVQGALCSECKRGFYNLIKGNPKGCTQCFCHAVTDKCTSSNFAISRMMDRDSWFVTDLHGTKVIALPTSPLLLSVANEDFSSYPMYYWGNAKTFGGNLLLSYGLQLTFQVSWVHARGDSSGKPVTEYDVIVQSTNNMLAFSNKFHEGDNATVQITLSEIGCIVLPDIDNNIIQIRNPVPAQGSPCSRMDVMEGLHDVKRLLIRAKYHTDQIEGMLGYAFLEKGDIHSLIAGEGGGERAATSVEVCECPEGYIGSSCENCGYGYRKSGNSWLNVCTKCDCNGHSPTCGVDGRCLGCEHNTTGDKCQYCRDGFYGSSTSQSPFSCKSCECPLAIVSNNFSPTCEMSGNSYECTQCPEGYEGPFCERCANGYFGNPTKAGDFCKACDCNLLDSSHHSTESNICDHLTGECLVCPRNTVGWNCDTCSSGHFGNPLNGTCATCRCDAKGSVVGGASMCNPDTGQCPCKDNFIGRRCTECKPGHGNPEEGCSTCSCNVAGSLSTDCDTITGQCGCKKGFGGRFCNKCLDLHYGFSSGCLECNCHKDGSDSVLCDFNTGQCHCLPNVHGRRCDTCLPGHWNIKCGTGCQKCDCNPIGSIDRHCDLETGQCICKPGVGGTKCDHCSDNCFGFNENGCRTCDPCVNPGHVCDSFSGRCGCPPNTEGNLCEKCTVGFWGFSSHGCKACNCSQQGSTTPQCSPENGRCKCGLGFEGDKCDKCKFGFFNYPHCTPCSCDGQGTDERFCNVEDGSCSCADNGQCHCKENVIGAKCDRCREGTYGLENMDGCMECFCFHRTNKCSQGFFKWQRFGLLNSQNLMVARTHGSKNNNFHFDPFLHIEGRQRCYVNLALPSERNVVPSTKSENQLKLVNNLIVIPNLANDIVLEKDVSFSAPLYWQLPHIFLGDKVLSYNGYLRFRTHSIGGSSAFPPRVLSSYPLVQIQRMPSLILEHYINEYDPLGFHQVRLHEDEWRLKTGPYNGEVTKEMMMVVLQNLDHIIIRGTHGPELLNATLFNVSLDIAIPSPGDNIMSHGIEVCDCPPAYNSTSCQNPRIGFYRWYKRDYITSTVIIDLIGEAKPCDCNSRSDICDTETGFCQNCSANTGGRYCDQCAVGYYGDPSQKCLPCPCPSVWNNHAESCYLPPRSTEFQCFCRPGYSGRECESCDYGYYGRPWEESGHCSTCNCNEHGSVRNECHQISGQCNCKPGVTGRDCSKCAQRNVIIGKLCTSCDDKCTGLLLNENEDMENSLKNVEIDEKALTSIKELARMDNVSESLKKNIETRLSITMFTKDIPSHVTLASIMKARAQELWNKDCSLLNVPKNMGKDLVTRINMINLRTREWILKMNSTEIKIADESKAKEEMLTIVDNLGGVEDVLEEITDMSDDELDAVNELLEIVLMKVHNSSVVFKLREKIKEARERLDDAMQYISQADKNSDEAARVVILAQEFLYTGRDNVELIDSLITEMDRKSVETLTTLSEVGYTKTELIQVLLMLEDVVRNFRNSTKELEILETNLFELVPLYRVSHAQPAFDHVKGLQQHAKYMEGLLIALNGSESFAAGTAYERIKKGFEHAFEIAQDAKQVAEDASLKVKELLSKYNIQVIILHSTEMMKEGLELSGIVENSMRNNVSSCKSSLDSLSWRLKIANDTIKNMNRKLFELRESLHLDELMSRTSSILDTVNEVSMEVMQMEDKIQEELVQKINHVQSGKAFDSIAPIIQASNAQHKLTQVKSEVSRGTKDQKDLEEQVDSIGINTKYLKALIKQTRHKANTVGVSVGPDDTGTCFRLYKWPVIGEATTIKFNFAATKIADSLLLYWPSSITGDFMSIEMVSGQVKASWDLGSGLRTLIHPKKLELNSGDPEYWVQIHLERIGSFVTLDVSPISALSIPTYTLPISYSNTDEELTTMDLSPTDLIHIGGMSKQQREGLISNGLSGCIHNLRVNQESLGLWNFVGNEGCAPCEECPSPQASTADLEYYFNGRGYSVVERIQSTTFNSKFFDVSLEFRTISEQGLIFLTLNPATGQGISLELLEGKVVMQVQHGYNNPSSSLRIESDLYKKNGEEWVKLRAVWVYQRGTQIGKLMIGRKDFSQEKLSPTLSLDLMNSHYHFGGVSPTFDGSKLKNIGGGFTSFVGCMKNILINNSPYDPLSGNYYGVDTPCGGKVVYLTSFEGNGFAEFGSQEMGKNFKFGFSFKTLSPTGLIMLSFNPEDNNYYGVYTENGEVRVQLGGFSGGPVDLLGNGSRYDDGKYHAIRVVKKGRRLFLYLDDERVAESRLPKTVSIVSADTDKSRGLFFGGVSFQVEKLLYETNIPVSKGFVGCIQNFYFNNERLSFTFPISHRNHNLGQCSKHHEYDPASVPTQFLYPNTIGSEGINRYDFVSRLSEDSCSSHEPLIEQEDPIRALQFGDTLTSFVTLSLDGGKQLKQRFNLTLSFRTHYPNGLLFQGIKKKGNGQCVMAYLKDGQVIVKFYGERRSQELVSPVSNLNDGEWHQISLVKAEEKAYLYVDNRNASQTQVPKKTKAISKLNIGGIPEHGHSCLENSIHRPEQFKGCVKNIVVNSHLISFETNQAVLNDVSPCFKNVERGSFFRAGSYAIYTYNLTLGNIMEVELDFRSDSKNGLLIEYLPNKPRKFPTFTIFLEDGMLVARESTSNYDFYEAVAEFGENKSACNGEWHKIRANYDKDSITLRIDEQEAIFALAEPSNRNIIYSNGNSVEGSLFIGGIADSSRSTKKRQFHGCMRNVEINRKRKDWTDMAFLSMVHLNSCPV